MGWDYALVHLRYTIPPAALLTVFYYPLCLSIDVYKIFFLVAIAVVSTTPWDSYLIRQQIWTYSPKSVLGPTVFKIPLEEFFFFFIQTYSVTLLYLCLSKWTFHSIHLRGGPAQQDAKRMKSWMMLVSIILLGGIVWGLVMVVRGGCATYMGLILTWAGPFLLILWTIAYQFIFNLPWTNTVAPIALPTLYLWVIDTVALKKGTWVIQSSTKLGWHLWDGLEIEEAVFFLATNTLIVFGLIAFDNALAIIHTFPCLFPRVPSLPKPTALVKALLLSSSKYDERRIHALQEAVVRLRGKSRSFSISSAFFYGRLRIDLIALYSFCRVADDLVDNAPSISEANHWIAMLTKFLDLSYSTEASPNLLSVDAFVRATFPEATRLTLLLLPTSYLPPDPLYDLLKGFQTDLHFSSSSLPFPILNEGHLKLYASRVAGSVAELCLELVFRYCEQSIEDARKTNIIQAGRQMGIALQYINIARDIDVDCRINRVYLPTDWLKDEDLTPEDVTHNSSTEKVEKIRRRLLKQAMAIYDETKSAIDRLPAESRGPMRVAVESYVEIGRVIDQPGYKMKAGRATVSKIQRLRVAWKALQSQ